MKATMTCACEACEEDDWLHYDEVGIRGTVNVSRVDLVRALRKARFLYVAHALGDAGPDDECWSEFERLANYLDDTPSQPNHIEGRQPQ